jgi:threonine dehydratase
MDKLVRQGNVSGVCAATRGNHGQSVAFAASLHGLRATIIVPEGNSPDKNRAMKALGARLITAGADFDDSLIYAAELAKEEGLHLLPSFDPDLVNGVGTYGLELFEAVSGIDRIYVPIGLGSGVCGVIAARNALQLDTEVIGVVSSHANTYELSLRAGHPVGTSSAQTVADGLAVRNANATALDMMTGNLARIVAVSDAQIELAMGHYFTDTHNIAEGAGAAGLAAVIHEAELNRGAKVATVLTGGNVSAEIFAGVLAEC